jgi:hypothetical protein
MSDVRKYVDHRCYHMYRGSVCGRKVMVGRLDGDSVVIFTCPRCRQPVQFPPPSETDKISGAR